MLFEPGVFVGGSVLTLVKWCYMYFHRCSTISRGIIVLWPPFLSILEADGNLRTLCTAPFYQVKATQIITWKLIIDTLASGAKLLFLRSERFRLFSFNLAERQLNVYWKTFRKNCLTSKYFCQTKLLRFVWILLINKLGTLFLRGQEIWSLETLWYCRPLDCS